MPIAHDPGGKAPEVRGGQRLGEIAPGKAGIESAAQGLDKHLIAAGPALFFAGVAQPRAQRPALAERMAGIRVEGHGPRLLGIGEDLRVVVEKQRVAKKRRAV